MQKSIDLANRAVAISVTHPGAYYLNRDDIESLYGARNGQDSGKQSGLDAPEISWLREHTCEDIAYLGESKDKDGEMKHLYRIGEHEVFHDMIHELEMEEVPDDEY